MSGSVLDLQDTVIRKGSPCLHGTHSLVKEAWLEFTKLSLLSDRKVTGDLSRRNLMEKWPLNRLQWAGE